MDDLKERTPEETVKEIIYMLVDDKEAVNISTTITPHTAVFDISVADKDVGKVLGKRGSHADALRVLIGAIYGKSGRKLHLQIVDPRRRGNNHRA